MVEATAPRTILSSERPDPTPEPPPLRLVSLFNRFDAAVGATEETLRRGEWPDTFLLLAGINQAAEDYLQRDLAGSRKLVALLRRRRGALAVPVATAGRLAIWLRSLGPRDRRVARWQVEAERVTGLAAQAALEPSVDTARLVAPAQALLRSALRLPRNLQAEVLRPPACFRSADQRPEDCRTMTDEFATRWGDQTRPIVVVGIRTSGSYLAPLLGAALRALGYRSVSEVTCRPGRGLGGRQAHRIRRTADSAGLVLVADDSPVSGRTYRSVALQVEALGVPHDAIVLMIALLYGEGRELPRGLEGYQSVVLPWTGWAIHQELKPDAVRQSLQGLLVGRAVDIVDRSGRRERVSVRSVTTVRPLPLPPVTDLKGGSRTRRHVRGRYLVGLATADSGATREAAIYLKGVGYGYFGARSVALSEALADFHPPVYGISNGCLLRAYLPDAREPAPEAASTEALATRIAAYAVAHRDRLRLPSDPTDQLGDWDPAWRRAADWMQPAFGRTRLLARPLLHSAARRLLRPAVPAELDGGMALDRWFGCEGQLLKVDYDERGLETHSADPAMQVAIAAADSLLVPERGGGFAAAIRRSYELLAGESFDAERWLLLRTVHLTAYLAKLGWAWIVSNLSDQERREMATEIERVRRSLSRVHQEYLGDIFLGDVSPPDRGPVCAIDIDGVLETGTTGWPTGYPATTPTATLALRALARHGYRAVLVSGRAAPEIEDRCATLRLAGGVAEYGAVSYEHAGRHRDVLVSSEERAQVTAVRELLRTLPLHVDPSYEHVARAYSLDRDCVRRPLDDPTITATVDSARAAVRAVVGSSQVDFVPSGTDKGSGLQHLLRKMSAEGELEMAIGDSHTDLSMLQLARRAYAPANSPDTLRRPSIRTLRNAAQRGLAEAVGDLIGHAPGTCRLCRSRELSQRERLLITALSAPGAGRLDHLVQVAKLALLLRR